MKARSQHSVDVATVSCCASFCFLGTCVKLELALFRGHLSLSLNVDQSLSIYSKLQEAEVVSRGPWECMLNPLVGRSLNDLRIAQGFDSPSSHLAPLSAQEEATQLRPHNMSVAESGWKVKGLTARLGCFQLTAEVIRR